MYFLALRENMLPCPDEVKALQHVMDCGHAMNDGVIHTPYTDIILKIPTIELVHLITGNTKLTPKLNIYRNWTNFLFDNFEGIK